MIEVELTDGTRHEVETVLPVNTEEKWMTWVSVATLVKVYGPESVSDHSGVRVPTLTVEGVQYVTDDLAFIDDDGYALWAVCELPLLKKVRSI